MGNISLKGPFLNSKQQPLNTAKQNAVIQNLSKHIKNNTAVDVHIIDTLGYETSLIRGASLGGKGIDAAKDKVKLHLNIDDVQTKEDACWFAYSSPYVAEGKTGLYSMPQIGDTVQLYIPNHREEEAFVRSSLREGGNLRSWETPSVKYWGNPFGKELKFSGNELRMTAQENHVFMKLHDNEGIELHSKDANVLHTFGKRVERLINQGRNMEWEDISEAGEAPACFLWRLVRGATITV
ncbi:hypothetical protein ABD76_13625 [Paenibacillus dendritiformis]|nr:hypothetical protein [Paenibacillus dendritiformis]